MSKPWTDKRSNFWWGVVFALLGVSVGLLVLSLVIGIIT